MASEDLITGDGDEYEKMVSWAGTLEKAIGNPIYEWANLELKRFFGIEEPFLKKNVPAIWEKANALLQAEAFKPRNLIKKANVKVICTTDDLNSDLTYHKLLAEDEKIFVSCLRCGLTGCLKSIRIPIQHILKH